MGGPGSGNRDHWWRGGKKAVVEDCDQLDANKWMREGVLKQGACQSGTLTWTYRGGQAFRARYQVDATDPARGWVRLWYSWVWTATGRQEAADYTVRLATTRHRSGGLRWWFLCPLQRGGPPCGRR